MSDVGYDVEIGAGIGVDLDDPDCAAGDVIGEPSLTVYYH
jgi:hypothetical protein